MEKIKIKSKRRLTLLDVLLNKQRHANWQQRTNISFLLPVFILLTSVIALLISLAPAQAATASTLNFQGRLLTNSGSLVPDGSYNIEFKIYDSQAAGGSGAGVCSLDSSTDDCWWIESRVVSVRNGYFSVKLADVTDGGTAFTAGLPWDQELWMTMNVNSDGEMTPRFKMTAVPFAFRAGAVVDSAGNAFTGDDLIQASPNTIQALSSAVSAIRYNQAGAGGLLQLQGDGVDVFTVDKAGATVIGQGLTLGSSTSTTAGTIRWSGGDFEGYNGSSWVSLTSGGGGGGGLSSSIVAFGKVEGATGNALNISGASSARNSAGNYTVTLNSALPTANYTILLTAEEPGIDDINANIISQAAGSFVVSTDLGDNGVGANVPTDKNFHFVVIDDSAGGGSDVFEQNGNAFGAVGRLGTTDTNGLEIITDDTIRLSIDSSGASTFTGSLDVDGLLSANGGIDITSGNLDLSNGNILGVNSLTATTISGSGASITNLDGSNISTGTIDDARLSSNIALKDTANAFTDVQTFTGGAILGNFTSTTAGAVRWTGTDFEGFDGVQWLSFTSGASSGTPAAATFYDSTGGATIAAGVFSTINLDATLNNSDATIIGVASDVVTVTEDGYYEVTYQVTSTLSSGTRSGFNAKLQLDSGVGFNDIAGSQAYHYGRITTETQGTAGATVVLDLSAGDSIRIQGQGTTESFVTVSDATSLSITRITAAGSGGGGGGSSFNQNGNAFAATGIIGTTDSFGLRIISGNVNALEFNASGEGTFGEATSFDKTVDIDGLLTANNGIDITSGNLNLSNGNITNVNSITATTLVGDGSGITNLDGSNIATGSINDARLSTNVALLSGNQTFTGLPTFDSGLTLGNSASTTAGTIRWTGTDFEGFDGIQWVSLTEGSAGGAPLLEGVLAFGKVNGATGSAFTIDGASVVRNGTGDYTVTLDTAATTANYIVQLTVEETAANLDDINISIDNQTTAGFDVDVREGDNSTTADVRIDKNWHFIVFDADAAAGGGAGSSSSFVDGGNAFGGTAVLGTTDTNGISIITDNSLALSISSTGNATFVNDVQFNGKINLGTLPTVDVNAQASFFSGSATGKGIIVQGAASQTENLFEVQSSTGTVLAAFTSSGNLVLDQTTLVSTATAARTINLPDASGTVCLSGEDCGFLELASGVFAVDATTNDSIAVNKTGASGNILALQKNGGAVFTVANTGSLQIQSTDSAALDVRNVGGSSFLSVDTSTGVVRVGPSTADANGVLLVLDTKNTAPDPTGQNGALYYNSSLGRFRCYEDGTWKDCIGTRQVRSYIDTTTDTVVDNNTTDYWDTAAENNNSYPNITPTATSKAVTASVVIEVLQSGTTADRSVQSRIERGIGSPPTCGSGTVVGPQLSTFTTNNGEAATNTVFFVDEPNTTSQVFYTVCSDSATNNAGGMTVTRLRVTLEEATNSN